MVLKTDHDPRILPKKAMKVEGKMGRTGRPKSGRDLRIFLAIQTQGEKKRKNNFPLVNIATKQVIKKHGVG